MIIGADGCSRDSADSDIALSVETAKARGLELKSFVFPRNLEGYRDVLAKYGFRVYRGRGNEWYGIIKNRLLSRACHLLDNLIAISPRTSVPFKDEYGLYNTTGNMLYLSCAGIRNLYPFPVVSQSQKESTVRLSVVKFSIYGFIRLIWPLIRVVC